MRYCYNCNRITPGEPNFCNGCGRSFNNVKLCPRLHPNPRNAEVCSQCGNRDLSTPQPKVPLWSRMLVFLLSLVPGFILIILSITVVVLLLKAILESPQMLFAIVLLAIAAGILAWIWSELPLWFRKAVYWLLKRKRDDRNGHR